MNNEQSQEKIRELLNTLKERLSDLTLIEAAQQLEEELLWNDFIRFSDRISQKADPSGSQDASDPQAVSAAIALRKSMEESFRSWSAQLESINSILIRKD